jgi:hypothetical protein
MKKAIFTLVLAFMAIAMTAQTFTDFVKKDSKKKDKAVFSSIKSEIPDLGFTAYLENISLSRPGFVESDMQDGLVGFRLKPFVGKTGMYIGLHGQRQYWSWDSTSTYYQDNFVQELELRSFNLQFGIQGSRMTLAMTGGLQERPNQIDSTFVEYSFEESGAYRVHENWALTVGAYVDFKNSWMRVKAGAQYAPEDELLTYNGSLAIQFPYAWTSVWQNCRTVCRNGQYYTERRNSNAYNRLQIGLKVLAFNNLMFEHEVGGGVEATFFLNSFEISGGLGATTSLVNSNYEPSKYFFVRIGLDYRNKFLTQRRLAL